ncbi:arabinan endo-1,5-alpha-L-arabinosidase [Puia dinghuensis]|uniref:Endo-arabinase n=1 Tax=Puia dinghuensis TaxID=1792502 RepID=A0A8J2XT01_9BACT|nr:arabinan endo-1,5-alpha-L-arabinosidase [Puia dinghuensis]GGA99338.1 endo-arabinase [Puia dinghuensis]
MRHINYVTLIFLFLLAACSKKSGSPTGSTTTDTTTSVTAAFDINSIEDTYADVADFTYYSKWGPYNVHDPSIKKFGQYYYCYSTDVAYGTSVRPGIQVRKSKDLVQWQFVGWVFPSNVPLPALGSAYITSQGGTPNNALWAPYVLQVGAQYRLYYSLSSPTPRLSVIGLATASSPEGPWTEQGTVVASANDNTTQTNAIDPTVMTTPSGNQYMYYGSAWDGIYVLKLDPATGLAATAGDKGTRIANRGFTNGQYNGNIEGAEIIYNATLGKYFLFIAYDWLQTKYNTRVCRADQPTGPFLDFNGVDANTNIDHTPMIIAPYQFMGHGGWQGVSHCTVFTDDSAHYYYASQARPAVNSYFMDLHVRKLFWTVDGWPVVSPERYAWEDNSLVPQDSLAGSWERIVLNYTVVPGYASTQVSPDMQVSTLITLSADGTAKGPAQGIWSYTAPWLQISWGGGAIEKVFVQKGRDWENKKSTIIFTGLNNTGTAVWGKKQ